MSGDLRIYQLDLDGIVFIVDEEGCPQSPYWPGGTDSGVTIGVGYDLGQTNPVQFANDWSDILQPRDIRHLAVCCGKKGAEAAALAADPTIRHIPIPRAGALQVFQAVVLPRYCVLTERTFPGTAQLCSAAQTALTSLIYNRGGSLAGDRRAEMRAMVPLVAAKDYQGIALQLTTMAHRLWPLTDPSPAPGLHARRQREAALVLSCDPKGTLP